MSDKEAPFLKNADIRAGKIPGWASKPETNGDPYDPANMERTDASMVVSDGLIMLNVASMQAAKIVGIRRLVLTAGMISFWGAVAYIGISHTQFAAYLPFSGVNKPVASAAPGAQKAQRAEMQMSVVGNSTRANAKPADEDEVDPDHVSTADYKTEARPDSATAGLMIDKFYSSPTDGVAKAYDLKMKFLLDQGWPKKAYDVTFSTWWWERYNKNYNDGTYKSASASVAETCSGIELKDCLPKLTNEGRFIALADAKQNMELYKDSSVELDDTVKPVENLEKMLNDLVAGFPKEHKLYCDSPDRRYADTWGVQQTSANLKGIQNLWQNEGKIKSGNKIVEVDSVKEMIELRKKGDKDCNNINIAVLPVKSGAVEYMLNVTARTHSSEGDQIASGLYLLGKLSDRNVMSLIACNNCSTVSMFNEQLANENMRKILPGLNISSKKIVTLFENSGYKLEEKTKKTTEEKGE